MIEESQQNAGNRNVCNDVARILDRANRTCRTVASQDLGSTPLYLLAQSRLPMELGTSHHYAFTTPWLDLACRDHIDPWFGRGPCAVINDIGISDDFDPVDFEYVVTNCVLHEFAHILDRPAIYDAHASVNPDRVKFNTMVVAKATQSLPSTDVPLYFGHGASFIRIVVHLAYRATLAGFETSAAGIFQAHRNGLSSATNYADALADEPEILRDLSFRNLLACDPPAEFTQLFAADVQAYHCRFPVSMES